MCIARKQTEKNQEPTFTVVSFKYFYTLEQLTLFQNNNGFDDI